MFIASSRLRILFYVVVALLPFPTFSYAAANPPALPSKTVSSLPLNGSTGRTIQLRAGSDLQAAINSAQAGDTLVLEAGATWTGNFILPRRRDAGWITIRGSAESKLPAAGQRVTPAHAVAMPTLLTPNSSPAITANDGVHGWRLVGLQVGVVPTWKTVVYQLILFGWGSGPWGHRVPTDEVASRFSVERCYIHGSATQKVQKGILANAADVRIADSWIDEIHNSGFDSQAILIYDSPGPHLIENNELQASSENIMLGGADSSRPDLVPSDVVIRRNHVMKPLRWKPDDPSYDGLAWVIKPLIELKSAQRVLIEGNILENSWLWPAFVTDAFNQDKSAPWSIVQDITFQHNVIKNAMAVFQAWAGNAPVRRVKVFNNNATGIRYRTLKTPGNSYVTGSFFYLINAEDVWIEHNTAQPMDRGTGLIEGGTKNPRLTIRNNVFGYGHGGFSVSGSWAIDDASVAAAAPGVIIERNALVNFGDALGTPAIPYQQSRWNPRAWTLTGTPEASGLNPDGTLRSGPLKGAAGSGVDLGVNFGALERAVGADLSAVLSRPSPNSQSGGGTGGSLPPASTGRPPGAPLPSGRSHR